MVRCKLSQLMGIKKVRVIDVARATGISRNMISALYYEKAKRIDFDAMEKLCNYFECAPGDLFDVEPDSASKD